MDKNFLSRSYDRTAFCNFINDFLPDDLIPEQRNIDISNYKQNFLISATRLGKCKSLELEVYEVKHSSLHDARVGLSKDAFNLLLHHSLCNRALIAFVPSEGEQWRLSLLEMSADINDSTNRIKRSYSNPRRFSHLLGHGGTFATPLKYLVELGSIAPRREGNKQLTAVEDLFSRFSVEALTKEFYNELFNWYQWAVDDEAGVYFPNKTEIADDDFEDKDKKIIRLLTRLMFVWFIKQKNLVPNDIFDVDSLNSILKDFDPLSQSSGNYYNAILQNLFFATLNRAIEDEDGKRGFAKLQGQRDIKTLYRYSEMFCLSEEGVINLFASVPFLNGGLFECLDKTKKIDGVEKAFNYDGFSRNDNKFANGHYRQRAFVPNLLFFDEDRGLINILKKYNFTIEENTPSEQTVALDPELLGKVFENLLGAYNPETRETARNQSGSFYTPREIVNYMVDESIKAYLEKGNGFSSELIQEVMSENFIYQENKQTEYQNLATHIRAVKILDPACGSGAFPMGLLNRIVDLLQKLEPTKDIYSLKLQIIENCIYGSDIQNIATQISKLRFFISLICDCEKDVMKANFGIPTLPNLETKFVTANSLISRKNKGVEVQLNLFIDTQITELKQELFQVRHDHFRAKTANEKKKLRIKDETLRSKLAELLTQGFTSETGAEQLAKWNPYDQNQVADFFDPEWMFNISDGFDIVIGNPPYIQLQNNEGELAKMYEPCGYDSFARTGDIYCLFYERGYQLLKSGGHLCYITSNKWMRAGYGEKTRNFLAAKTNPKLLIDFAGVKIFESATVDTNILLFENAANSHHTVCAITKFNDKNNINELSDFVKQNHSVCNFSSSDSWVILSQIEQSIKQKIEAVGTPLKDWDIQINYGIKTGYNEAFIITTEKREEILAACKTTDERERTAELIRPILRGRDIKRYSYDWAGLWLIATFPAKHYDIEQYPALKGYLLSIGKEKLEQTGKTHKVGDMVIKSRKKTNNKWFETQDSIAYWDDFNKPKIMYPNMTMFLPFYYDTSKFLQNDKSFMITGEKIAFLTAFLNSSLFKYCFRNAFPELQGGTRELRKIFFEKIPVIQPDERIENYFKQLVDDIQKEYKKEKAMHIDREIFNLYNLSNEEITEIGFIEIK